MVENAGSSAQRIRIGLTGLGFAFLLVLLGSAITRSGETDGTASINMAENVSSSEPLAELGVAPGSVSQVNSAGNAAAGK